MSNAASVDAIYIVQAGDSLSKIAHRFYGDAQAYAAIARQNNLDTSAPIAIGQRLVIPSGGQAPAAELVSTDTAPAAPAGSPVTRTSIEEIVVTAKREWWTRWQVWAGATAALGLVLFLTRRRK